MGVFNPSGGGGVYIQPVGECLYNLSEIRITNALPFYNVVLANGLRNSR